MNFTETISELHSFPNHKIHQIVNNPEKLWITLDFIARCKFFEKTIRICTHTKIGQLSELHSSQFRNCTHSVFGIVLMSKLS